MILQRVAAGFVPLQVQPHQVHPISTQLDRGHPQTDQIVYRDNQNFGAHSKSRG